MKKQDGFSVVEGLLIVIIIALLGVIGWYVWHNKHTTKASNTASASQTATKSDISTNATKASIASNLKSYTLHFNKLSFQYPAGWTLKDTTDTTTTGEGEEDLVDLTTADGFTLSIDTPSGSHPSSEVPASIISADPIKFAGKDLYLIFAQYGTQAGANQIVTLAQSASKPFDTYQNSNPDGVQTNIYIHGMYTGKILTADQAKTDPNLKAVRTIIESMHY